MRDWRWFRPPDGSIPTLQVPVLDGVNTVHLIGVGGAGMRNLARLARSLRKWRDRSGARVTDKDISELEARARRGLQKS